MPTTAEVAHAYTALLLAGEFAAAGERFWAADVKSIDPCELVDGGVIEAAGIAAARAKKIRWLSSSRIDDLAIDGPFVTGNQFALFIDMMLTNRASGDSQPFTEIAIFTVCDAKITEERYFYE